jgi:hypothetical protein
MFFNAELFRKLMDTISRSLQHDATEIWELLPPSLLDKLLRKEKLKYVGSLEKLNSFLTKEGRPPERIYWLAESVPVLVGSAEHWDYLGGPQPYHDTYTFSLFTRESAVRDLVREICHAAGNRVDKVEDIITAVPSWEAAQQIAEADNSRAR